MKKDDKFQRFSVVIYGYDILPIEADEIRIAVERILNVTAEVIVVKEK
jgi:hypothetical protein